jgi:ribosomal protein S18 acetylase RimI-like enzyme
MRYDARVSDLVSRALDVNEAFLALGCEQFEAEGAAFVRNRSLPAIRDANHVSHVTASTANEIDRLLAKADQEYDGIRHRAFFLDHRTPPQFIAKLAFEGYQRNDFLVMLLEGELAGAAKPYDIKLVDSDVDWQMYADLREIDFTEYAEEGSATVDWNAEATLRFRRSKEPPVRFWLAYEDDKPVSYLASWEGPDGVGQVEDLFTHPDYRRRGIATALIHHGVADVREHGAGPVIIVADPADTPKDIYAALGFRPIALKQIYWKNISQ